MAERGQGVQIGRIRGIPIHIGVGWFLVAGAVVLVTQQQVGLGSTGYLVGVGYVLVLFASVLAHELAHALAARAHGLLVHRIKADFFGGHTAFDGTRLRPGASALISFAGPAANLVVGGLAWAAMQVIATGPLDPFAADAGLGSRVVDLTLWVTMWLNLALAGLNLLPGLPLDGGQIVDALVWKVTGRRGLGLVVAGAFGVLVAIGLLVWFVIRPWLMGRHLAVVDLLWLALVLPFLVQGARGAIRRGRAIDLIDRVDPGRLVTPAVVLPVDTPLGEARAHGEVVLAPDEHGRPSLLLAGPGSGSALGIGLDALSPNTPISALVTRLPHDNILEATGDLQIDLPTALAAMSSSGVDVVVLTRGGAAYGVLSKADVRRVFEGPGTN